MKTTIPGRQDRKTRFLLPCLSVIALFILVILMSCPASQAGGSSSREAPSVAPKTSSPSMQKNTTQQTPKSSAQKVAEVKEPSPAERVVAVLRAETATDSLNPQLHYQLANALHDVGNKEEALLEYDKTLSLKPDFKEALVNKGALLNELGSIQDAIGSFQRALTLDPRDTRALVNLGNSFYAMKMYDDAMKQYKLAVEADTGFAEGYYYMGVAFADAGIYREAVREWERILAVAPSSEAAKNAQENIDVLKGYLTGTESGVPPVTR